MSEVRIQEIVLHLLKMELQEAVVHVPKIETQVVEKVVEVPQECFTVAQVHRCSPFYDCFIALSNETGQEDES